MKKLTYLLVLTLGIISCSSDDDNAQNIAGTYSGIFTVEYYEDPIYYDQMELSNNVTIEFENGTFSCSSGEDHIPAGGSGTYEIAGAKIIFSDTNGWYANFDWNLILNGEYDYLINGNQLTLSASKNNIGFYKYELEKE